MKFSVIFSLVLVATATVAKSVSKKSSSSDSEDSTTNGKSAIIAIQIVDPDDEKSGGKQSKRTIDNALGYGFQGNHLGVPQAPRYEVYKYSQYDIPPFKGPNLGLGSFKSGGSAGISNQYLPGTTLFSSIDQNGQIGRLSPNLPNSPHSQSIPVIILKVLPSQLTSNHLYPSLPSSNLFAPIVNSIDLKSLLDSYVPSVKGGLLGQLPNGGLQYTKATTAYQPPVVVTTPKYTPPPPSKPVYEYQPQTKYHQQTKPQYQPQTNVQYQQQTKLQYQPQKQYYQQQEQYYQPQKQVYQQQLYQTQNQHQHGQAQYEEQEEEYQPQQEQYQQQYQSQAVEYEPQTQSQAVEYEPQAQYQEVEPRQPHVQYQSQQQDYDPEQYQSYQSTKQDKDVDIVKAKEYVLPTRTYYYPTTPKSTSHGLLTYENYPSETHTRVVFKTEKGHVRTSSKTEEPDSAGSYATTPNLNYEKLPSPSLEYNEEEVEDTRYVQYENAQQDDDTPAANYIYVKNSHQS